MEDQVPEVDPNFEEVEDEEEFTVIRASSVPSVDGIVSPKWLRGFAEFNDLQSITVVNLRGCSLRSIDNFGSLFPYLTQLHVACNLIEKLPMPKNGGKIKFTDEMLEQIDPADKSKNMTVLYSCPLPRFLVMLDISGNLIRDTELTNVVDTFNEMPFLDDISLYDNPVEEISEYRRLLIRDVKRLAVLDEHDISDEERNVIQKG